MLFFVHLWVSNLRYKSPCVVACIVSLPFVRFIDFCFGMLFDLRSRSSARKILTYPGRQTLELFTEFLLCLQMYLSMICQTMTLWITWLSWAVLMVELLFWNHMWAVYARNHQHILLTHIYWTTTNHCKFYHLAMQILKFVLLLVS